MVISSLVTSALSGHEMRKPGEEHCGIWCLVRVCQQNWSNKNQYLSMSWCGA